MAQWLGVSPALAVALGSRWVAVPTLWFTAILNLQS